MSVFRTCHFSPRSCFSAFHHSPLLPTLLLRLAWTWCLLIILDLFFLRPVLCTIISHRSMTYWKLSRHSSHISIDSRATPLFGNRLATRNHVEQQTNDDQRREYMAPTVARRRQQIFAKLKNEAHLRPDYAKMTDAHLTEKLASVHDYDPSIVQWLDTSEECVDVRRYAQLLTCFYCAQYQRELWETCYEAVAMFSVWPSTTTKATMTLDGDLNEFLFLPSKTLNKQHNELTSQCGRTQQALQAFEDRQEQLLSNRSIDGKQWFARVKALVQHDLCRLRTVHEWEKILFWYDLRDYRSLALFYDLKLTNVQVWNGERRRSTLVLGPWLMFRYVRQNTSGNWRSVCYTWKNNSLFPNDVSTLSAFFQCSLVSNGWPWWLDHFGHSNDGRMHHWSARSKTWDYSFEIIRNVSTNKSVDYFMAIHGVNRWHWPLCQNRSFNGSVSCMNERALSSNVNWLP